MVNTTAYLWEQVWQRDSLLEILGRYMVTERNDKKQITKIIFPRYHQLDATRRLLATVLAEGAGPDYVAVDRCLTSARPIRSDLILERSDRARYPRRLFYRASNQTCRAGFNVMAGWRRITNGDRASGVSGIRG